MNFIKTNKLTQKKQEMWKRKRSQTSKIEARRIPIRKFDTVINWYFLFMASCSRLLAPKLIFSHDTVTRCTQPVPKYKKKMTNGNKWEFGRGAGDLESVEVYKELKKNDESWNCTWNLEIIWFLQTKRISLGYENPQVSINLRLIFWKFEPCTSKFKLDWLLFNEISKISSWF